eukprot:scaffold606_cov180-Amphora_coffeaeformis.AAC.3
MTTYVTEYLVIEFKAFNARKFYSGEEQRKKQRGIYNSRMTTTTTTTRIGCNHIPFDKSARVAPRAGHGPYRWT